MKQFLNTLNEKVNPLEYVVGDKFKTDEDIIFRITSIGGKVVRFVMVASNDMTIYTYIKNDFDYLLKKKRFILIK